MIPDPRRGPLRLGLSAIILHVLLVFPNRPSAMTPEALLVFPQELPVLLCALVAAGNGRSGVVLRGISVAALMSVAVLKAGDLAMFTSLSRGFNPVADLPLIAAGARLLAGAIGALPAVAAICASAVALGVIAVAAWWATGVWSALSPPVPRLRWAAGWGALLSAGVVAAEIGDATGKWDLPLPAPGAALTLRVGVERFQTARATLADLIEFRSAAAEDPYAEAHGLLDLIDRDVLIVFVESYGRTSLDTAFFADLHRPTLAAGAARLDDLGVATASGYLASPTRGGQSWLAHATFANGLWIDGQTRYGAVLTSGRQTLFHLAAGAGFRTAAVMPQITLDWPEADFMGFETVLAAADLGYEGLPFNWVTMPDQFTFSALDRLLRDRARDSDRPLFVQVATGSSHAPWVPVPDLVGWDEIGDGRIFDDLVLSGDPPEAVWRDRDRVRAQYRLAVDYALRTVLAYAALHARDPPLMVVMGDHQATGFVALDERPDVPIHVVGPAHLVARTESWGLTPGLIPPSDAPVRPMDEMRDLFLETFSSGPAAVEES